MKKMDEVSEILKTDANENLSEYGNVITKTIIRKAIVGLVLSLIVSIALLFFRKNISPIVKLEVGLFTEIMIFYFVLCVVIVAGLLVLLKLKPTFWIFSSEKKSLRYYFNIAYVFDLINFFVSALLIIYLILLFILTPTTVIGGSMNDTFHQGDKIFVWHLAYSPSRGDVVVVDANSFDSSGDEGNNFFIKRLVALPGDRIKLDSTGMYVNDIHYGFEGRFDRIIYHLELLNKDAEGYYLIPEGKCFLLGDNRDGSSDSRYYGLFDLDDVLGHVVFRVWPIKNIGFTLDNRNE